MTDKTFEELLKETRDNRQKAVDSKQRERYTGTTSGYGDYKSKNKYKGKYDEFSDLDDVNKDQKRFYNADKDDKSRDHTGDYEGGRKPEDERTDSATKQGYEDHPEREKYHGKKHKQDDPRSLTKDVKTSHESSERKQHKKTRKKYESDSNVNFESVLKESRSKLQSLNEMNSPIDRIKDINFVDDPEFNGDGFYIIDIEQAAVVSGPYGSRNDAGMLQSQLDEFGRYSIVELGENGDVIY